MLWEPRRTTQDEPARAKPHARAASHRVTHELAGLVEHFATARLPLLVCGERGVGKTTYTEALVSRSGRAQGPVVRLSCRSLPAEEDMFGHERIDARGSRVVEGQIARADGGVLVLEDVDELPVGLERRFRRLLHDGEIVPVGSALVRRVDVRVLATCGPPKAGGGALAHSLFPLTVTLPPLRTRPDDVEALARHFARTAGAKGSLEPLVGITREALVRLRAHTWPGNVHELRTAVEEGARAARGGAIDVQHLTLTPAEGEDRDGERDRVLDALSRSAWNQSRAAELLGVSRRTVIRKMQRFGIPRPRKG